MVELERDSPYLVTEVQSNDPHTPAEDELPLTNAAMWAGVESLLSER